MFVYKITNIINNKIYIGITKDIKARFKYHKTRYKLNNKREYNEKPLYKAFRKYGIENFIFEILYENLTKEEAENKEIELIDKYKSLVHENGYNITKGGSYRSVYGEKINTAVLTESEVIDIRKRVSNGEVKKLIYNDYKDKISRSAFQAVYRNIHWKHLAKAENKLPQGASLSLDDINKIRNLYNSGIKPKEISKLLNFEYKKCWRICTNRTYTNI